MLESTKKRVESVTAMHAKGMSMKEALKTENMGPSTYYTALKKMGGIPNRKKKKAKNPYVENIPTATPEKLICLIGSASDIHNALKGLL